MVKVDLDLDITSSSSALDWVEQSRQRQRELEISQQTAEINKAKKLAEDRRKAYEEEEEQSLISSSMRSKQQHQLQYKSSDLKGLQVKHGVRDFEAGEEVILTLADSDILATDEYGKASGINDNDDDILENVNFAENERISDRKKRMQRLRQPLYAGYDDEEFADGVVPGAKRSILSQYDVDKKQRAKLVIGMNADASLPSEETVDFGARSYQSLHVELKPATAFKEVKFRKHSRGGDSEKKKRTIRERTSTKDADDEEGDYDLGKILASGADGEEESAMEIEPPKPTIESTTTAVTTTAELKPAYKRPVQRKVTFSSLVYDDEDQDLSAALSRARQAAIRSRGRITGDDHDKDGDDQEEGEEEDQGAKLAKEIALKVAKDLGRSESKEASIDEFEAIDVEGRRTDGKLILNSTTEFASRLQASLTEKARLRSEAAVREMERGVASVTAATSARGGETMDVDGEASVRSKDGSQISREVNEEDELEEMTEDEDSYNHSQEESHNIEDDEQMAFLYQQPLVSKGMASTLALLKSSGELKQANELAGRAKDDRRVDPSQSNDFGVKLEYRDEKGRKLTQKEAFRQLSYRFHGQGPGKKKMEKRMKALEIQKAVATSKAGVLDGSGGTMKSLTKTLEATGKSHIIVQGNVGASSSTIANIAAQMAKRKENKG